MVKSSFRSCVHFSKKFENQCLTIVNSADDLLRMSFEDLEATFVSLQGDTEDGCEGEMTDDILVQGEHLIRGTLQQLKDMRVSDLNEVKTMLSKSGDNRTLWTGADCFAPEGRRHRLHSVLRHDITVNQDCLRRRPGPQTVGFPCLSSKEGAV